MGDRFMRVDLPGGRMSVLHTKRNGGRSRNVGEME